MAFGSDDSCVVNPNVALPRVERRRPKLVPPKLKRFTRARINLNHVWPLVDGDQDYFEIENYPLQSSSRFNCSNQLPYPTQRPVKSSGLLNKSCENVESVSACVQVPFLRRGVSTDSLAQRSSAFNNQLKQFKSCSAPTSRGHEYWNGVKPSEEFELPLVSLGDLAAVLGECVKEDVLDTGNRGSPSFEVKSQPGACSVRHVGLLQARPRRLLRASPSTHHFCSRRLRDVENETENNHGEYQPSL